MSLCHYKAFSECKADEELTIAFSRTFLRLSTLSRSYVSSSFFPRGHLSYQGQGTGHLPVQLQLWRLKPVGWSECEKRGLTEEIHCGDHHSVVHLLGRLGCQR